MHTIYTRYIFTPNVASFYRRRIFFKLLFLTFYSLLIGAGPILIRAFKLILVLVAGWSLGPWPLLFGVLAPLSLWALSILSFPSLYGSFSDLVAVPWRCTPQGCERCGSVCVGVWLCVWVWACAAVAVALGAMTIVIVLGRRRTGSGPSRAAASGGAVPRVGWGAASAAAAEYRRWLFVVCEFVCVFHGILILGIPMECLFVWCLYVCWAYVCLGWGLVPAGLGR